MGLQSVQHMFNSEILHHYFLCNYRPKARGSDELSESLLRFKNGWPIDVTAWVECSVTELKHVVRPGAVIIRALSCDELAVRTATTGLDKLGQELAVEIQGSYLPELLCKHHVTQPLKTLKGSERLAELENVYYFKKPTGDFPEIVILDDICTSGTTVRSIVEAIREMVSECKVTIYTLATTAHDPALNTTVKLDGLQYHWKPHEGWVAEEDLVYYQAVGSLKEKIQSDFTLL